MENAVLILVGIMVSILGIINIRGNISTIHSYNRRKVREEDVPAYGKAVGTGTLIIGVFFVISGILSFWREEFLPYVMFPSLVIGLGFILYGQFKYNKGIF